MDRRAEYVELHQEWRSIATAFGIYTDAVNAELAEALRSRGIEAGKSKGRTRTKAYRSLLHPGDPREVLVASVEMLSDDERREVIAPYATSHEAAQVRYQMLSKAYDRTLDELAGIVEPKARADAARVATCVHTSTYSTQGFGATRYAERSARMIAADYQRANQGVAVTVVRNVEPGDAPRGPYATFPPSERFDILVAVETEADVDLVRRRAAASPITLREWVKQCWGSGVNPRVYMPLLPVGYEAKEGLDFFGGETRSAKAAGGAS